MTVGELIERLGSFPRSLRVVVDGYKEGRDDFTPDRVIKMKIDPDVGTHSRQGKHGDPNERSSSDSYVETAEALAFRRASH